METGHRKTIRTETNTRMYIEKQSELLKLETYKYFLLDLIPLIKENLSVIKKETRDDYNKGRIYSYFDVLSLIQQQAINFGINLKELDLEKDATLELFD